MASVQETVLILHVTVLGDSQEMNVEKVSLFDYFHNNCYFEFIRYYFEQ